jgi:RNA polymerase sigma factor (sigma-70 family)
MHVGAQSDFPQAKAQGRFASTHWSVVLAAGRLNSAESNEALATLCQVYWYPLYAYARRRLNRAEDAQDLTQGFFAELLEKAYLQTVDPGRGKFRSFLVTAFQHYLSKQTDRAAAQKRGGHRQMFRLDFQAGESRYHFEPADHATPESIFERRWALTLLDQTLSQLREEMTQAGRQRLFEILKETLTGDGFSRPYSQLGAELDMSEQAIKVAVHRLRRRYRELLRASIAETVPGPAEIDSELRDLFAALQEPKK